MNSPTSTAPTTSRTFTSEHYEEISSRLARSFVAAIYDTLMAMHEEAEVENGSVLNFLAALASATMSVQFAVTEALSTKGSTSSTTPREYSEYFLRCVTEAVKFHYDATNGADVAK